MTELPPHLAALVEGARKAHEPSEADRERVFGALKVSLGAGAVAVAASQALIASTAVANTPSTLPAATGSMGGIAAKWWVACALVIGGGGAAGFWAAGDRAAPARGATRTSSEQVVQATALAAAAQSDDTADMGAGAEAEGAKADVPAPTRDLPQGSQIDGAKVQAAPETQPTFARAPTDPRHPSSRAGTAALATRTRGNAKTTGSSPRRSQNEPKATAMTASAEASESTRAQSMAESAPPPVAHAVSTTPSNQDELALVRATLTALRDLRADAALALLEEHARRFPRGAMAHERNGLRVVALCAAGRLPEGQREQAAFLRRDSQSALAQRVRNACAVEAGESAHEQNREGSR